LENNETGLAGDVGFAEERLFSAVTWSRFFNGQDKTIVIDSDSLKEACAAKISEAEERYNYVKSVIPEALDETRADIDRAHSLFNQDKFIMCLYGASKAKSEADVLLSLMGVEEKRFDEVIGLKLNITREALMKAQQKGIFPIIAYSYYEYADSLRDFDRVSSLLFSEYALELANLDIYFEEKKPFEKPLPKVILPPKVIAFVFGAIVGGIIVWIIVSQMWRRSASAVGVFQTLQAPRKRRLRGKKR
jgi:predicted S18 family serine protease